MLHCQLIHRLQYLQVVACSVKADPFLCTILVVLVP